MYINEITNLKLFATKVTYLVFKCGNQDKCC